MKKEISNKKFMMHFIIGFILYQIIFDIVVSFFTSFLLIIFEKQTNFETIQLLINIIKIFIVQYLSAICSMKSINKKFECSKNHDCTSYIIIFYIILAIISSLIADMNLTTFILNFVINFVILITNIPYISKKLGTDDSSLESNYQSFNTVYQNQNYSYTPENYIKQNNFLTLNKPIKNILIIIVIITFILFVWNIIKSETSNNNDHYYKQIEENEKIEDNKTNKPESNKQDTTQSSTNKQPSKDSTTQSSTDNSNKHSSTSKPSTNNSTSSSNTVKTLTCKSNYKQEGNIKESITIIAKLKNNKCYSFEMAYNTKYSNSKDYIAAKKNYSSNDIKLDDKNLIISKYIGDGHEGMNGTEEWAKNKTEQQLKEEFKTDEYYGNLSCTVK